MHILSQPKSQYVRDGAALQLFINIGGGSGSYTYQWKINAVDILNATANVYVIENFSIQNVGTYTVVVTDTVTSDTVTSSAAVMQLALPFSSEQSNLINFDNLSASKSNSTITIPMSSSLNNDMIALTNQRRANLKANVEKPLLEAAKQPITGPEKINGGAYFDPQSVFPTSTFKQTLRPVFAHAVDSASKLSDPLDLATQDNYVYKVDEVNYQKCYYTDNTWRDSKGRINLFEKPYTRISLR
jgi:hypothetical protein